MALLEVVTRCNRRPKMLAQNVASLDAQLCGDWVQTLLTGAAGKGMAAAQAQLAEFCPYGQYVLLLDDDDVLVDRRLVLDLQRIVVTRRQPPAVIVRMDHGPLGVLPDDAQWMQEPQQGRIGCSAIITRADVWMKHRGAWASARYESDFDYIHSVWEEHGDRIVWHDTVASRVQRRSMGAVGDA